MWSPTKDELYYVAGDTVMAVAFDIVAGEFQAEPSRTLVDLPAGHNELEIAPDGERFMIIIQTGEDPSPTELHVTTNWFEELKHLAPAEE